MLQRTVDRVGRRIDRMFAHPLADGETFPGLARLPSRVRRLSVDVTFEGIGGWLTLSERRVLHALAYWLDGPFLEIGSWLGLSTSCIASGIRRSGIPKRFISNDLNPTVANFRPTDGGIGLFIPSDSDINLGDCPVGEYEQNIRPFLERPGGVMGCLKENLERNDLLRFVEIIVGPFADAVPSLEYRFVFCDCLHNPVEIYRNVPSIATLVSSGGIFACHDTTDENEACLRTLLPVVESCQIDSLFVARLQ